MTARRVRLTVTLMLGLLASYFLVKTATPEANFAKEMPESVQVAVYLRDSTVIKGIFISADNATITINLSGQHLNLKHSDIDIIEVVGRDAPQNEKATNADSQVDKNGNSKISPRAGITKQIGTQVSIYLSNDTRIEGLLQYGNDFSISLKHNVSSQLIILKLGDIKSIEFIRKKDVNYESAPNPNIPKGTQYKSLKGRSVSNSKSKVLAKNGNIYNSGECSLTVSQVLPIRGLRLGMSGESVIKVFKQDAGSRQLINTFNYYYGLQRGMTKTIFTIQGSNLPRQSKFSNIATMSLSFHRMRLEVINFTYDTGVEWKTDAEFIGKINETLKLPPPDQWHTSPGLGSYLSCKGFTVNVKAAGKTSPELRLFYTDIEKDTAGLDRIEKQRKKDSFKP